MTMIWDEIIGQPEAIKRLRAAAEEKASHAFLFWGPEGVGKKRAAKAFAAALNCEKKGCAKCLSCKKIHEGTHPDVREIEPEGDFLTIDQIRSVQHTVYLKPSEGRAKVFIIDEADRMTVAAANAFLKTLEEPPAGCVFVLITCQPENLLPTVASRCQNVRFSPTSSAEIKEFLVEKKGFGEEKAVLMSRASGGVLEKAIALAESEEIQKQRRGILSFLAEMERKEVADLLEKAQELVSAVQDPLVELKEEQEEELGELVELAISSSHATHLRRTYAQRQKRRATRREHNEMETVFDVFFSWYADLLSLKQDLEGRVVNRDYLDALRAKAASLEEENILKAVDVIQHGREMFRRNVNSLLALEATLIRLGALR